MSHQAGAVGGVVFLCRRGDVSNGLPAYEDRRESYENGY